jgi:WD40 repeat protein
MAEPGTNNFFATRNGGFFDRFAFGSPSPFDTYQRPATTFSFEFGNVLFTADGESLIIGTATSRTEIRRFDSESGVVEATSANLAGNYRQIAMSLDGSVVYGARGSGGVGRLATSTMAPVGPELLASPTSNMRGVVTIPAGPQEGNVAGSALNGSITLWDPSTATIVDSIAPGGDGGRLAVSPDGQFLYGINSAGVRRFTINPSLALTSTYSSTDLPRDIAISPDGRRLAVVAGTGLTRLWIFDLTQADPLASPVLDVEVSATLISRSVRFLASDIVSVAVSTNSFNNFIFYSASTGNPLREMRMPFLPASHDYSLDRCDLVVTGTASVVARQIAPIFPAIVTQTPGGSLRSTVMDGVTEFDSRFLGDLGDWELVFTGDFNGDRHSDLVFYNPVLGRTAIWTMLGNQIASTATFNTGLWVPAMSADVNGDGYSDLLFFNGPQMAIWYMNGTRVLGSRTFSGLANWELMRTGDLNGDGIDDLIFRNLSTQAIAIWIMNSQGRWASSQTYANPLSLIPVGTGDFNGDGNADLLFQNPSGGSSVWLMDGTTILADTNFAAADVQVQGVGDLDADGKDDIVLMDVINGLLFAYQDVATGSSFNPTTYVYGTNLGNWFVSSIVDLNGDNKDDLVWVNSTTNEIAVWTLTGQRPWLSANLGAVPSGTKIIGSRF